MRREVLRLEQVTYKEKDVTLLQDFDLSIFEGEVMGLLPVDSYGKGDGFAAPLVLRFVQIIGVCLRFFRGTV